MRKFIVFIITAMLLSSCSNEVEVAENNTEIVSLKSQYEFVIPYKSQKSYTYFTKSLNKNELDEISLSLMSISKNYFETDDYFFMEDQYFNVENQKNLIDLVNPKVEETINGLKLIPRYLIGVQIQNYTLSSNGDDLDGIAVGLVLDRKQVYKKDKNSSTVRTTIDETELINNMKLKIPTIIEYLRSIPEFSSVKMVVGFYVVDNSNILIPGSYKQFGYVSENSNRIALLNPYDKMVALLPSSKAARYNSEFNQKFIDFVDNTKSQYNQNVGIVGRLSYSDSRIDKLSITVMSNSNKKTFLLSLTQTVYNEVLKSFNEGYDVEVVISTYDKVEATIVKSRKGEFIVTTYE